MHTEGFHISIRPPSISHPGGQSTGSPLGLQPNASIIGRPFHLHERRTTSEDTDPIRKDAAQSELALAYAYWQLFMHKGCTQPQDSWLCWAHLLGRSVGAGGRLLREFIASKPPIDAARTVQVWPVGRVSAGGPRGGADPNAPHHTCLGRDLLSAPYGGACTIRYISDEYDSDLNGLITSFHVQLGMISRGLTCNLETSVLFTVTFPLTPNDHQKGNPEVWAGEPMALT